MLLEDKVAIVTGVGPGLGRAAASRWRGRARRSALVGPHRGAASRGRAAARSRRWAGGPLAVVPGSVARARGLRRGHRRGGGASSAASTSS